MISSSNVDINKNIAEEKNLNALNIIKDEGNDKITMIYKINKGRYGIYIFGYNFVKNNKANCKMIINEVEYDINSYIKYNEYGINKKDDVLTVILNGVNKISDASFMFSDCESLQSLPDISKWDTENVKDMALMFGHCKIGRAHV